jgi:large subunit ribosomal protein L17
MRHGKSGRKLKRTASHRRATLGALATALLKHKRITTTVAKAKETRMLVEKMITRAKNARAVDAKAVAGSDRAKKFIEAAGHARREVAKLVKDREAVTDLFTVIAEKVATRPGGYTRIVKLGRRYGDAAEMAVIELVDFNAAQESAPKKKPAKKTAAKGAAKRKTAKTKKAEAPAAEAAPSADAPAAPSQA